MNIFMKSCLIAASSLFLLGCVLSESAAVEPVTYTNPVAPDGEDPWVMRHEGMYYYVFTSGPNHMGEHSQLNAVWVTGSQSLVEVCASEPTQAWAPEGGTSYSKELWAPELHYYEGAWYIYVAADDGNNDSHRTRVLRRSEDDPRGPFEHLGELALPEGKWSIDATLCEIGGDLYCIWSGWPGEENVQQNLYICAMEDPLTPKGERALISQPEHPWELRGGGPGLPIINEGASVFHHDGRTFLIYASSGSWSDFYCLGLIELTGEDPMAPESWTKQEDVWFESGNGVIAPGHASVTMSPDGSEYWLVYHSAKHPGAGWDRQVNLQRIHFNETTGLPEPGTPARAGEPQVGPSCESGSYAD